MLDFFFLFKLVRYIFNSVLRILVGFLKRGSITRTISVLIIGATPFFAVICNEILVYSFPIIFLFLYVSSRLLRVIVVEGEDEQHDFFLRCCELSLMQLAKSIYMYRYVSVANVFLSNLVISYIHVVCVGQEIQHTQYIQLIRSFSVYIYKDRTARDSIVVE